MHSCRVCGRFGFREIGSQRIDMKGKNTFGLIGYPLSHSFSKKYFTEKFKKEGIFNSHYELFPLEQIHELPDLIKNNPTLKGLNVTIPYKKAVFPFLNEIDLAAEEIGAVNTIKIENGKLKGYNTDVYGFEITLLEFLPKNAIPNIEALVLGSGGAAKAIIYVLKKLNIPYKIISRSRLNGHLTYGAIDKRIMETHHLIVNATPVGMYPYLDDSPMIPYEHLSHNHFLYDLVYNPEKTLFLAKGEMQNAKIYNGLKMLYLQAEKAWEIWSLVSKH